MNLKNIIIFVVFITMISVVYLSSGAQSSEAAPEVKITLLHYSQRDVEENPHIHKSQGIPTVAVGQTVYLQAGLIGKKDEVVSYRWSLVTPAGSKTGLSEASIANPTLLPDVEGQYHINLAVTFKAETVGNASLWLSAGIFVGDGLLVKTGNKAQCIHCHEEIVNTWKATAHGTKSQQGTAGTPAVPVAQCESCHGPGSQHGGNVNQNRVSNSMSAGACAVCHETTYYEWSRSDHALPMNNPATEKQESMPGCALCHVAQAYWDVILGKKETKAPYQDKTGITCATCHDPHSAVGKDYLVRAGTAENACMGCHDTIYKDLKTHVLYFPQGLFVKGTAGDWFIPKNIPPGTHSGVERNCIGCHMAPPGEHLGIVGGHTFLAVSKDKENAVLNVNGCLTCHKTMNLEILRSSQEKTKILLNQLADLMPQLKGKQVNPFLRPKFPFDPSLSKIEAQASFNYYLVVWDQSFGIHNPVYIRELLKDSIRALETEKAEKTN